MQDGGKAVQQGAVDQHVRGGALQHIAKPLRIAEQRSMLAWLSVDHIDRRNEQAHRTADLHDQGGRGPQQLLPEIGGILLDDDELPGF